MRRVAIIASVLLAAGLRAEEKPTLVLDPGGHTGRMRGLAFTPDGKQLVSASADHSIRFWNVESGELVHVIRLPQRVCSGGVMALAPDGHLLATTRTDSPTEHSVALIALPEDGTIRNLVGHTGAVVSLAFSADGKRLAAGDQSGAVKVWDIATGRALQTWARHTKGVESVAFSPDGRRVACSAFDWSGSIWDIESGQLVAALEDREHPTGWWNGIAWSPDGTTIATGCFGRCLRLWNADGSLRERHTNVRPCRSMVFTKDSKAVLSADFRGSSLFDLERKQTRAWCGGVRNEVWSVALSPDERVAAVGGGYGEDLFLWSPADGKVLHRLAGKGRSPRGSAWSPDGKSVAWGLGGEQHEWGLPDALAMKHPLDRSFDLTELAFGPTPNDDWRRARTTSGALTFAMRFENGGTAGWVDVKDGDEVIATIKQGWSRAATFLPGERIVLSGSGMKLYQARTGELLRTYKGGTNESLVPSPDDRYLLGPRGDQSLAVWKLDQDEALLQLFVVGDDWIAWTSEGYYSASPGGERLMGWQIDNGPERLPSFHPAARFRKTLNRPDVIKLLLKTGSVERALAEADKDRPAGGAAALAIDKVLPPTVSITSPAAGKLAKAQVGVTAVAESRGGHAVTALRLVLDGQPVAGKDGVRRIDEPKEGEVRASWTVTLSPGKHRLQVLADSAVSQGASDEITVDYAGETAAGRQPRLIVLAVGVSKYKNANVGKLDYAASDAKAVAAAFEAYGKALFRDTKVKLLTDELATRDAVMDGLDWLVKETSQDDYAIVFFAGHGEPDNAGSVYFLPVDADKDKLRRTAVAGEELMKTFRDLPPSKRVLILDACHAGGVGAGKKRSGNSVTDPLVRELLTPENGVVVMCSSTGREFSQESHQHKMGVFTLALTEALSGKGPKDGTGLVFTHHLHSYVCDRVKELTKGQQHPVMKNPDEIRSFPVSKP